MYRGRWIVTSHTPASTRDAECDEDEVGSGLRRHAVLRQIDNAGYATNVHHMRKNVELHAIHPSGDEPPHIARNQDLYLAPRALADMVGLSVME